MNPDEHQSLGELPLPPRRNTMAIGMIAFSVIMVTLAGVLVYMFVLRSPGEVGCSIQTASGTVQTMTALECEEYKRRMAAPKPPAQGNVSPAVEEEPVGIWDIPVSVPEDWFAYSDPRLGFSLRYPEAFETKTGIKNDLFYGNWLGFGGAGDELTITWYIRTGDILCGEAGRDHSFVADAARKGMDASTFIKARIGEQDGKVIRQSFGSVYLYQAYVRRPDANIWFVISFSSAKQSALLFRQFLAGITFEKLGDVSAYTDQCK